MALEAFSRSVLVALLVLASASLVSQIGRAHV
jgi:hypothetical protein